MRRLRLLLILLGIAAFLVISALLARALNAENGERTAITGLIAAEAQGEGHAVAARLQGCDARAACHTSALALAAHLRRTGMLEILQMTPSAGFSLGGSVGTARVAWNTSAAVRPVVQCVQVRRAGNVLTGLRIELLALSPRIRSDSDCPRRF